jgi:hypothetical protein
MPTLTITKTYQDGDILLESDLDNIKDDVETFLNVTKLDGDNLQNGSIDTDQLAASAVTAAKLAGDLVAEQAQVVLTAQVFS